MNDFLIALSVLVCMIGGAVIVPNLTQAYRKWYDGDSIKGNVISITITMVVLAAIVTAAMFINVNLK